MFQVARGKTMTAVTLVTPFLALTFAIGLWSHRWSTTSWILLGSGTFLILAVNMVLLNA